MTARRHRLIAGPRSLPTWTRAAGPGRGPDPSAPGGWRADPEVKAAILACFADRTMLGRGRSAPFTFRDRVAPPKASLRAEPWPRDRGPPGASCPGGTTVRPGPTSRPASWSCRRRTSTSGRGSGEDTMVDSHVLVGSCAQIGARVHLSAGVTIGGVLEPAPGRSSSRTRRSSAPAARCSKACSSAAARSSAPVSR